jgi:enoyl reductase-like protein
MEKTEIINKLVLAAKSAVKNGVTISKAFDDVIDEMVESIKDGLRAELINDLFGEDVEKESVKVRKRKSADEIDELYQLLIGTINKYKNGVCIKQIMDDMKVDRSELQSVLKKAFDEGKIRKKRNTVYFPVKHIRKPKKESAEKVEKVEEVEEVA